MVSSPPAVLILGHSFVRSLSSDLSSNFDAHASEHFDLVGDIVIHLHGVSGRTVEKLRLYDIVGYVVPGVVVWSLCVYYHGWVGKCSEILAALSYSTIRG